MQIRTIGQPRDFRVRRRIRDGASKGVVYRRSGDDDVTAM